MIKVITLIFTFFSLSAIASPPTDKSLLQNFTDLSGVPYVEYGDPNADIVIDEYASLSCGHCRSFYESTFVKLKEDYIDKGEVYFRYFHFPLDKQSLKGALLVHCFDSNSKQQKLIQALFKTQSEWAFARNEKDFFGKLRTVALIAGINEEKFDQCINNRAVEDKILQHQLNASKAKGVNSTPTIFINGEVYKGKGGYEGFKKELERIGGV